MEKASFAEENEINILRPGNVADAFEKEYADFIDLAAHDLDAPLRKLILLVGMLSDKLSPDPDVQAYFARIKNCVGDMRSLVDDLSILARITSDKREFGTCNLDSIISQALRELPDAIKEKKAIILPFSLPEIEGDASLFKQLFKNLLENAIKFGHAGNQPEICLQSAALTPEEKNELNLSSDLIYYKIEIADNGIGFNKENAGRIFRPFVRLHGKSQFPGNGIGLATCKKIMEVHHGIIYAESHENEGARFILVLPEIH